MSLGPQPQSRGNHSPLRQNMMAGGFNLQQQNKPIGNQFGYGMPNQGS